MIIKRKRSLFFVAKWILLFLTCNFNTPISAQYSLGSFDFSDKSDPSKTKTVDFKLDWTPNSLYQSNGKHFFTPSPEYDKKRFRYALGIAATTYTGFSVTLYHTWYKQYSTKRFHFFNDMGEWENMDKFGHIYTAYFQGVLCYRGAKWTGLNEKKSILTGVICGSLFQSTIEIMDGFSNNWGFSIPDFTANVLGVGLFAAQQKHWKEQRISFKVSSWPKDYPEEQIISEGGLFQTTIANRARALYGSSWAERYLKDYNAQTLWASFNIASFLPKSKFPKWLNVAVGYGAENMYGGFTNSWEINDENLSVDPIKYPRYQQFYLSLDIDFSRIKTDSHFLKALLRMLNVFKAPSPALEINTRGEVVFHFLHL